jgi:hypothetical protein
MFIVSFGKKVGAGSALSAVTQTLLEYRSMHASWKTVFGIAYRH